MELKFDCGTTVHAKYFYKVQYTTFFHILDFMTNTGVIFSLEYTSLTLQFWSLTLLLKISILRLYDTINLVLWYCWVLIIRYHVLSHPENISDPANLTVCLEAMSVECLQTTIIEASGLALWR